MDSLYTNEIGFIKLNKTCILWIVLLICSKFIHLSYIGCNAFQSHLIYWDPDNIIFQTKPVPLLRVKPKDEIIFVCAQESIYILWTYEFKVFESCSMWLNDNLMVNLLLKCPDKSNRKLQMRRQSTTNIPKDKLNLKTPQNLVIKNYSSLIGNSSTVQNNYVKLKKYSELSIKRFNKRSSSSSSSSSLKSFISHSPLIDRKKHPSQFTLLVEEFAWANGNPSFPVNRPVYFLAQPSVCHSRNMRLGIVNGDFTGLLSDPYVNRFQAFWFTNNSGLIPSLKRNSSFLSNSDLNNYDQSIQKNIIPKNKHSLCSTTSTSLSSSVSLSIVNGYFIIPIIIFYICLN
ncbi:unnamed protein product [Schistosoma rodhaini]|uniref:Ephrin RBD domain-containing protein n=1 Tax=Schistosoma mansoni TaxID=6183 RepID=A0A3Q0KKT9_SCHMA|nr:unnamed protein product [Schistosoma rodhaini]